MEPLHRRALMRGAALGAIAAAASTGPAAASSTQTAGRGRPPQHLTLTATAFGIGSYIELPFAVPGGVRRVDVVMRKSNDQAKLGIGLFDSRGTGYQSGGFRGIYGEERSSFYVSTSGASDAFMPGPMPAGTWTIMIPVFGAAVPTEVKVHVTMRFDPQGAPFQPGPEPGVVVDTPGWYRGDLHCHTTASSDAWASGSAMTPAEWANASRKAGLDYVAMTDHNVVSQNYFLARDAGSDVLLMPGEEMTNWFHGHATVSGIEVGDWLDFRQSPLGAPLPSGHARIREFVSVAEAMGAYISVAHPKAAHLSWQFAADAETDPGARTNGYEVWTGPWQPDDEASLTEWDAMLTRGWRIFANGGSDLHGVQNDTGGVVGKPTTVVYAQRLAKPDIVAALKAGRSFITRSPEGVELYLTASTPGQATYTGGSVFEAAGQLVTVQARVRRAGGMRLSFITQGATLSTHTVSEDDQTVEVTVPVPPGSGYIRAEVRGRDKPDTANPKASELDMEAFTNPIFLVVGDPPAGYVAETAPVPERAGPRRTT